MGLYHPLQSAIAATTSWREFCFLVAIISVLAMDASGAACKQTFPQERSVRQKPMYRARPNHHDEQLLSETHHCWERRVRGFARRSRRPKEHPANRGPVARLARRSGISGFTEVRRLGGSVFGAFGVREFGVRRFGGQRFGIRRVRRSEVQRSEVRRSEGFRAFGGSVFGGSVPGRAIW